MAIGKSRTFIGAKKTPSSVSLDTLHEQVRHPQSIEQITGTVSFVSVVLSQIQKRKNICVPGFQVNSNGTLTLAASLIDVTGGVVENAQHGNDAVRGSVGAADIGGRSTNIVNRHSDTSGVLGDDCTVLERLVDTVDGVFLHGQEEARTHLRVFTSSVEQGGSGVREVLAGKHVVGFNRPLNIVSVNADSDSHEHHLRAFRDTSVELEEVGLFQSLEAKVIVFKVTGSDDSIVKEFLVLHDSLIVLFGDQGSGLSSARMNVIIKFLRQVRKAVRGFLVQVADGNAGCQVRIIGVLSGKRSRSLGSEFIEFRSGDSRVNTLDDLL
mmetsp:Transcript_92793/g.267929  ORF Transcript_92793/g.267929 Transcript_92793/m.267929 type:complete len:324 (+) Transcript_92793:1478-2449(+)